MSLMCRVVGHSPKRDRARYDGDFYWAPCDRCGSVLMRDRTGWRIPTKYEAARHEVRLDDLAAAREAAAQPAE